MRSEAKYFFIQDNFGTDYFVHFNAFENGDIKNRVFLSPSVEIAFKFDQSQTGNALRATEAWLFS